MTDLLEEEILIQRNKARAKEFQLAVIVSAERLIGPLFPLFWITDIFYSPADKWSFLPLRLSVTVYCVFISLISRRASKLLTIEILSIALLAYPSLIITYMTLQHGIGSPYYSGLNLIAAGGIYFFPWSRISAIFAVSSIYLPYILSPLYTKWQIGEMSQYVINLFFICGTIIISAVVRLVYEKLKKEEVRIKLHLENEIVERNNIIRQKTQEAIKLSTLTKQFSPQVVHSIISGKIDVGHKLNRAKICAIFIDIVNSTERINRIDKDDINKVLSMFMEDTMKVLLKYDITIDKFLGDGVLAFSNAPIEHTDYIERVVNAAIEIRERIALNRDDYLQYWLNELQIRIGVSSGYANVGFYGSDDYFKSYTAIGKVINLASRLCGAAEPSQMLISQDVAKAIEGKAYVVNNVGLKKLKGFEQDIINVYSVVGAESSFTSNHAIPTCPNGHGILHLNTDDRGIYLLMCRTCNFVMKNEASTVLKKVS